MFSGRVKQSRASSAAGFIGGLVMIGVGVFFVIPLFGGFGVIWTVMAAVITIFNGYGLFSPRGRTLYEMEIREPGERKPSPAGRLAELEDLRRQGLITDSEYQDQRARIIADV